MRRAGAAAGAVLLLLPFCAGAERKSAPLAEIPIRIDRHKVIVPATVGQSGPLRLILDTGMPDDGILLFHADKVDREALDGLAEVRIAGAGRGGAARALRDEDAAFSVGSRTFEGERVTILDSNLYKGFPTDGVIGHSLLGHFAVEVDPDERRMLLYEPTEFSPEAGWESIDIYFKNNRIPWTNVRMSTAGEEAVEVAAYIDSASSEALELLARETNAYRMPETSTRRLAGRGLSGDVYGRAGRVSKLGVGPFVLENVGVLVVPAEVRSRQEGADVVIGGDVLRRFRVIYDYAHGKIHLRPSRSFTERFP